MYFQPYGDEQQLNLNWIINEIINLHKQLDPDYETPSFTQVYPYSNLNRLNLDWILSELKALKELAPEPTPVADIQAVAEALVALPFDSNTSYQIYDFISKDGEIWRATEAIPAGGVWDSTKWFKTTLGQDLAVLERWINSINNSLSAEIEARQNADTTLQTNINNEALARQQADTALQNAINGLTSANISDDSDAGGANVKASLNNLKVSLNAEVTARENADNAIESSIAIVADGNTHAAIASGQYVFVKNHSTLATGLYKATAGIPLNGAISSTNVSAVTSGGINELLLSSGVDNLQSFMRFPDGTQICYGSLAFTPSTWTAWGGLYTAEVTVNQIFAMPFINDNVLVTLMNGSSVWSIPIEVHTSATQLTTITVTRPTQNTQAEVFRYIAIGKWR